jgi:hypothetical protein
MAAGLVAALCSNILLINSDINQLESDVLQRFDGF